MRITLASTALGPGGVWRHLHELGCGLGAAGHDVELALLPAAVELRALAVEAGLACISFRASIRSPSDVWHLHLHDTYDRLAAPALLARRARSGVSIVTEHLPHSNASDKLLLPGPRTPGAERAKWALKRAHALLADRMIAVGEASQRFLCRRYGLEPGKVPVVYYGIPREQTVPLLPGKELLQVAVVGSLIAQKGHDILIRAAACAQQQWQLTVVGTGAAREQLERLAEDLAPGRVRFSGWQADPRAAMAAADVVCVPSRWEAFPYVGLEAGALGRPAVASAVDALPEMIAEGITGYLVPPDDPVALAGALDLLAARRELVPRLGGAARDRIGRLFPFERMIDGNLAVYREAAGGG